MLLLVVPILLVVLAMVGLTIFFAVRAGRRQTAARGEFERRFEALGARLGGRAAQGEFTVDLGGQPVRARIRYGKNGPLGVELSTYVDDATRDAGEVPGAYRDDPRPAVAGRPRVLLRRETARDRLGKLLRINREAQTGEAAFDAGTYVESDAPDADVRRVLAHERVRRGVRRALEVGFHEVVVNGDGPNLVALRRGDDAAMLDAEAFRAACDALRTVAGALPCFTGAAAPGPWNVAAIVVVASSLLATFSTVFTIPAAYAAYRPLDAAPAWAGVLLGAGAFLLIMPLVALAVRGRSTSFRVFLASFLMLLVGLPAQGVAATVALNGRLDGSPPAAHTTRVLSKRIQTNKNSRTHYVRFDGIRAGEQTLELPVSERLHDNVRPGDEVVITTGSGRFGWTWVRRIAPARPRAAP